MKERSLQEAIIVWSSVPDSETGEKLAELLVKEELAACVHLLPTGRSFYSWKGKMHRDREQVVMIKSRAGCYKALEKRLRKAHPYDVPEILVTPVSAGYPDYLKWLDEQTGR